MFICRAIFKFDGPKIVCTARGSDFDLFKNEFSDNERAFGYIRYVHLMKTHRRNTDFLDYNYYNNIIQNTNG